MHRRFGDVSPEGILAVDLSGPHVGTPTPDRALGQENEAFYFLAAYFYGAQEEEKVPETASGVDASTF